MADDEPKHTICDEVSGISITREGHYSFHSPEWIELEIAFEKLIRRVQKSTFPEMWNLKVNSIGRITQKQQMCDVADRRKSGTTT